MFEAHCLSSAYVYSTLQEQYPDTGEDYLVTPEMGLLKDVGSIVVTLTSEPGETPIIKDFQAHYCEEAGRS